MNWMKMNVTKKSYESFLFGPWWTAGKRINFEESAVDFSSINIFAPFLNAVL